MNKKEKRVIYLALSISRVFFLFGDYILSNNHNLNNPVSDNNPQPDTIENILQSNGNQNQEPTIIAAKPDFQKLIIPKEDVDSVQLQDIKQDKSNNFDDIQVLKNIYSSNKNTKVLNILLEKLVNNYQFDEAKSYILSFNS
jgi:hypothetical protein